MMYIQQDWTVPSAELCAEAASLGLYAEVSAAQQERAEAERRVRQCVAPAELHTALAAAVELGGIWLTSCCLLCIERLT